MTALPLSRRPAAHAIATCLPTPVRPLQHLILTARHELHPSGISTVDIDDRRLEP
ncbi:hypothetical protein PUR71_25580 [Streptomyces sp. SP17BM10]|uniref:hypothetical protein n=1 Tax=Streptomyces sp. SP17BM10 TaxID=3002530 RepID=UPI002E7850BE|nr:hypothetical protein [Streptomyces sp. SP17BM10]MEE1786246.1 hypothetical protein [Streptomyces sp. SP17BM10]